MTSEIEIRYSDELIRIAARRFLVRYVRRDVTISTAMVGLAIGLWLALGFDWKPLGFVALALILVLVVLASGIRYTRSSIAKFRALKDPTAYWRFSPEFVAVKNENGSSEFRWQVVTGVWRYPDVWLLLFGDAGYSVLPVATLSAELREFIAAQVSANGGKVE